MLSCILFETVIRCKCLSFFFIFCWTVPLIQPSSLFVPHTSYTSAHIRLCTDKWLLLHPACLQFPHFHFPSSSLVPCPTWHLGALKLIAPFCRVTVCPPPVAERSLLLSVQLDYIIENKWCQSCWWQHVWAGSEALPQYSSLHGKWLFLSQ